MWWKLQSWWAKGRGYCAILIIKPLEANLRSVIVDYINKIYLDLTTQGASMGMQRGGVFLLFWGPMSASPWPWGHPGLHTQAWVRRVGQELGASIWDSHAFKLRVMGSASMLRSINEWPSENGGGGWRDGGGEWQRKNCKALREWRLRPVSPR